MRKPLEEETQLFNLGKEAGPWMGLHIRFPDQYSDEDKEAIWDAIAKVQDARGLKG